MRNLPFCLIIMDGFGEADPGSGNAVALAKTPNLDALRAEWPSTTLRCSGMAVGLPDGQMGNSEVGHLNIGAGRVVFQELTRINLAIEDGSLYGNEALGSAIDAAVANDGAVHLMGLVSDGGVHSHQEHLYALLRMANGCGAERVYVHCFLDGRDVPPESGAGYVEQLEQVMNHIGVGRVASVMGRYYAMDRDNRWERVERAWRAIVLGEGAAADDAVQAVRVSYTRGVTDEFVEPVVLTHEGRPLARVEDGDAVLFADGVEDVRMQNVRERSPEHSWTLYSPASPGRSSRTFTSCALLSTTRTSPHPWRSRRTCLTACSRTCSPRPDFGSYTRLRPRSTPT